MSSTENEIYEFFDERSNTMIRAGSLSDLITRLRQQYQRTGLGAVDYTLVRNLCCLRYPTECETLPLPLIESAKSFLRSMREWNASGRNRVTETVFNERKSICLSCSNWRGLHSAEIGFCSLCRCSAGKLSLKLWMDTEVCPIHKWGKALPSSD